LRVDAFRGIRAATPWGSAVVRKIGIALAVIVVLFVGFVAMQPTEWKMSRSTTTTAPPEAVYAVVSDLNQFVKWSPWLAMDPNAKNTVTGPAGAGQKYAWEGNDQVGAGEMITTKVVPNEQVVQDLHFLKPFESKAVVTFTIAPDAQGAKVTWGFDTERNFPAKAAGVFMDMDKMLGDDFQRGLDNLKKLAEEEAARRMAEAKKAAEAAAAVAAATPPADAAAPATPAAKP
jgi:uncharacterized protein YndB with AHSA1/START domain